MIAWFLIEQDKLKLNKELCFVYSLAHDLVEIYAGDTYIFDKNHRLSKYQREKDALIKIKKRFPNFKDLIKTIEKYEKKEDEESKFVYALDKIITPIQIYLEEGKLWHEKGVVLSELIEYKNKKIALSKYVNRYWKEILLELNKNKVKLFPAIKE
jgi:putative hydrolase of HD superfamily